MPQPTDKPTSNDSAISIPSYAVYLALTCVSATAMAILLLLDAQVRGFDVSRGVYALLGSFGCATFMGYLVRSERGRTPPRQEAGQVAATGDRAEGTGGASEADIWWSGYATALEDQEAGMPRTVLPFKLPRGDRTSDSGHRVNGSELR